MTIRSFATTPIASTDEQAIDELEAARTAGLARMHPNDVAEGANGQVEMAHDRGEMADAGDTEPEQDFTNFQVRINSIESSLDGGVGSFGGEVQIEEYLNNHFIARTTILLSVTSEAMTPIGEIEHRLLEAALERLRAACALTTDAMVESLKQTRRDEDVACATD
jgi:hypothetical protein